MSMCKFVLPHNHARLHLANIINPISAAQHYFHVRGTDLNIFKDPRLGLPPEPFNENILEGPLNGEIVEKIYYPKDGYLGKDQMIFMVEVKGKRFKVIYSIWVYPLAIDEVYQNPEDSEWCPGGFNTKELPTKLKQ